tara:strand:- start:1701 stop:3776 length:2076 start_codon:yes stop_codon:yes gene_type:complete
MQKIELYISGQRVNLFSDESVSLTQSIKNVRDVQKIYTEFTKTFNLPASKTNNKIFKHYYNFNIENTFDARKKVDATIELNSLPFKNGTIQLTGVDLQNGIANTYKVTFIGNTVNLKDLFGQDKLDVLTNLNTTQNIIDYDASTIKILLTDDPATNDIIVPLITHTQRLTYNSSSAVANSGNLKYNSGGTIKQGVRWDNLKPAMRVDTIVQAIQQHYGLTFSTDFFNNQNESYYGLFMWMHRKKGFVQSGGTGLFTSLVNTWQSGSGTPQEHNLSSMISTSELFINATSGNFGCDDLTQLTLRIERQSTSPYTVEVFRNGNLYFSASNITDLNYFTAFNTPQIGTYTVTIISSVAITFDNFKWTVRAFDSCNIGVLFNEYDSGTFSATATFSFIPSQQLPDLTVIDFIVGIFKMFNLVAYVNADGETVVETYDSFYNPIGGYKTHEISQYVDVSKTSVDTALPYKQINFGYKEPKTFLAKIHSQLFAQQWGKIEYNNDESLIGTLYTVELPFEHMKFERLFDSASGGVETNVQWGYSVDDNQSPSIGNPLLFYPVRTILQQTISYVTLIDDDVFLNQQQKNGAINLPSNSVSFDPNVSMSNINFDLEPNEWTGTNDFSGTLFNNYYSNWIGETFRLSNRLTKITAYLPQQILLNLKLSDRFIWNNRLYKINSITTNLKNDESKIELLNEPN